MFCWWLKQTHVVNGRADTSVQWFSQWTTELQILSRKNLSKLVKHSHLAFVRDSGQVAMSRWQPFLQSTAADGNSWRQINGQDPMPIWDRGSMTNWPHQSVMQFTSLSGLIMTEPVCYELFHVSWSAHLWSHAVMDDLAPPSNKLTSSS